MGTNRYEARFVPPFVVTPTSQTIEEQALSKDLKPFGWLRPLCLSVLALAIGLALSLFGTDFKAQPESSPTEIPQANPPVSSPTVPNFEVAANDPRTDDGEQATSSATSTTVAALPNVTVGVEQKSVSPTSVPKATMPKRANHSESSVTVERPTDNSPKSKPSTPGAGLANTTVEVDEKPPEVSEASAVPDLSAIELPVSRTCHSAYVDCLPDLVGDVLNCDDLSDIDMPIKLRQVGIDPYKLDGYDQDGLGCEQASAGPTTIP